MRLAKHLLRLLTLFAMPLFINTATAQPNLPAPIDPDLVFTNDGIVEVIETLPLYSVDGNQVYFYDYETGDWNSYPYPDFPLQTDEAATPNFIENRDGTYTLNVDYYIPCTEACEDDGYYYEPPTPPTVRERWHFDRQRGVFTPYQAICGDHARTPIDAAMWIVLVAEGGVALCNTTTGQMTPTMQIEQSVTAPALLQSSAVAPDRRTMVFSFYYDTRLWAYDFTTHTFTLLGKMSDNMGWVSGGTPRIKWVDNKRLLVEVETSNYGGEEQSLYKAVVNQNDSVELIHHSFNGFLPYHANELPATYVWVGREGDTTDTTTPEPCRFYEYDVATEVITSYFIENVCTVGWEVPDGSGDHITNRYPDTNISQKFLIRYNYETGLHESFSVGRLQSMNSVSPDGRYLVITLLGDDGRSYEMAVLDLQTQTTLEPTFPNDQFYTYGEWINNTTFQQPRSGTYQSDHTYTVTDAGVTVESGLLYKYYTAALPDKHFRLVYSRNNTLDIFNVETLESTPFAKTPEGASLYATWTDDGSFIVTVWHSGEEPYYIGRWRVRFNLPGG